MENRPVPLLLLALALAAPAPPTLSVATQPAGAAVYIDGAYVGRTPFETSRIADGDHRVRVARDGYLDNGRVVAVHAGQPRHLNVTLTPYAADTAPAPGRQAPSPGGSGGSVLTSPYFWAAVGGGVAAVVLLKHNAAPVAGPVLVTPSGIGMLGFTSFSLSSPESHDPDGDALSYAWNFGDLSTATGATATHFYTSLGTYTVHLSISDGHSVVAPPDRTIVVAAGLPGSWTGAVDPFFGVPVSWFLAEAGNNLGGSFTLGGNISRTIGGINGAIGVAAYPTDITLSTTYSVTGFAGTFTTTFVGTADGTTLTGTLKTTNTQGTSQSAAVTFHR